MSYVFAEKVRETARYAAKYGEDFSDFSCILATICEDAARRMDKGLALPRRFLYHHPVGWMILIRLMFSIMTELAPDPEQAREDCLRALKDLAQEKPVSDKPDSQLVDLLSLEFRSDRAHYKPPKELPVIDDAKVCEIIDAEAARAKRIVDAWRGGVDLEKLPA